MAQNWLNKDGLFLQYGTDKAIPEVAGDYLQYGANRMIELLISLPSLTSTAAIQSYTTLFPAGLSNQMFIERVEVDMEIASAGGTSFSVGLIQTDQATIPSNYSTAFVNALVNASTNAAGDYLALTAGSTSAGGLIGSSPASATGPYYITALASGTYTTGSAKIRILYRGLPPITQ